MAVPQPLASRKGPASAWNRLKTPSIDALEVYGLPSKGETRLNDFRVQETYYNKIVERYMKFCSAAGGGDELDKQFSALSISPDTANLLESNKSPLTVSNLTAPAASSKAQASLASSRYATAPQATSNDPTPPRTTANPPSDPPNIELQRILSALRKLRESITATHRHDTFAQRCYIFTIRACILTKSWESYHPALLYLLGAIHKHTPLGQSELREFVGYRILDEACRVGDLAQAHRLRVLWHRHAQVKLLDARVDAVLDSLVHDNWYQFWRTRRAVDGYQRALMAWAEDRMKLHALKSLGRTYLTATKSYIESCTGSDWPGLVKLGVAWELQDDASTVVIRRPKGK